GESLAALLAQVPVEAVGGEERPLRGGLRAHARGDTGGRQVHGDAGRAQIARPAGPERRGPAHRLRGGARARTEADDEDPARGQAARRVDRADLAGLALEALLAERAGEQPAEGLVHRAELGVG